jgi:uncharacterized protein (TIGR02246 family)
MIAHTTCLAALVLAGCAAAPAPAPRMAPHEQTAAARHEVEQAAAHAIEVFKHGDAAAMGAIYAPDAVFVDVANDRTTVGRAAIQASFEPIVGKVKDFVATSKDLAVYGDAAYELGSESATGFDGRDLWRGKYVSIWMRQPDGRWLLHRDIFYADPRPSVPTDEKR